MPAATPNIVGLVDCVELSMGVNLEVDRPGELCKQNKPRRSYESTFLEPMVTNTYQGLNEYKFFFV